MTSSHPEVRSSAHAVLLAILPLLLPLTGCDQEASAPEDPTPEVVVPTPPTLPADIAEGEPGFSAPEFIDTVERVDPSVAPAATSAPAPAPVVAAQEEVPAPEVSMPTAQGHFTLQVGLYRDEGRARAQIARLEAEGIPAYTVAFARTETGLTGTYWRVRVGYFVSRPAALAYGEARIRPLGLNFWVDRRANEESAR